MKYIKTLIITILCLLTGQTAWAASSFTVTNTTGTSKFVIKRTTNTSTTETVYYRTVSLSAIAGQHFTDKNGSLTFDANNNRFEVEVTETTPSSDVYKYQTAAIRKYRFEVVDPGGFYLASCTREISNGLTQFTDSYVNKSVTDLVYFQSGSVKSGSGNKYLDVAHSGTNDTEKMIDDGYDYDNNTLCTVSTGNLYNNNTALRTWLDDLGYKMYATVYFQQREVDDGYQYIQILADNASTYDGKDGDGKIDNGPTTSLYKAAFILTKTENVCTNWKYQAFPHKTDNQTSSTEFDYSDSYLYAQAFKSSSDRATTSGSLILDPTVNNINVRFDANGSGDDTWYLKNLKVRLALVDATAPTASGAKKANGGRHSKGNTIYISVPFDEIVVVSGTPTLSTSWGNLSYFDGSGSNVLTFSGTISDTATGALTINSYSGTIKDLAGNSLSGTISGQVLSSNYLESDYPYPITYELNGGTLAVGYPTTYGYTAAVTLTNPTRTGYTFDGWTGSNGTTPSTAVEIPLHSTGDKSYTANWTANTYAVTLNNQSATTAGTTSVTATYDATMPAITPPTRTGYTFGGYYTAANGGGTQYYNADGASAHIWDIASETILYAKWTANTYTVTFDGQSATTAGSASVTATYDAGMPAITLPERTGYTFGGYYTAANGGGTKYYNADGTSANNWNIASATILYAQWTANTYTVTFDGNYDNNGIVISGTTADMPFTYGTAQNLTTNGFTREGYTFSGWNTQPDGTGTAYTNGQEVNNLTTVLNGVVTLYAQWSVINWTGSGDSENDPYLILYASQLVKLADDVNGGNRYENKWFKLGNNINMNGVTFDGIGIGSSLDHCFHGNFNGDGKTISNVTINKSNQDNVGFFGIVNEGTVRNLILDGASITGKETTGVLVSYGVNCSIENCLVLNSSVTNTDNSYIGIICGYIDKSSFTGNHYHNCTVTKGSNTYTTNIGTDEGDIDGVRSVHTLALPAHVTASSAETVTIGTTTYYASNVSITLSGLGAEHTDGDITYRSRATVSYSNDQTINLNADPSTGQGTFTMPATDATVTTEEYPYTVKYIDADGIKKECTDFTVIQSSDANINYYGTRGQENWYVVSGDVTINGQLYIKDSHSHLILRDGATLTVNKSDNDATYAYDDITIYGQTLGTGTITTNGNNGIYANKSVTINGGTVSATGNNNGINGYNVTINGGTVSATGNNNYGIKATDIVTLGCRNTSDRITASSFDGGIGVVVKSGQILTDGTDTYEGTLTTGQINAIAGKTLQLHTGSGTETDPYIIYNKDDLMQVVYNSNYKLAADIDMSGVTWGGIKNFRGTFDGAGHTISNVTINRPDDMDVGLFNRLDNSSSNVTATVKNLILDGATITGKNFVGALVGSEVSTPTIENCVVLNAHVAVSPSSANRGAIISPVSVTFSNNYYANCSLTINGETRTSNIGAWQSDCDGAKGIYRLTLGSDITQTAPSRTSGTALNSNITLYADGATISGNDYYTAGNSITVSLSGSYTGVSVNGNSTAATDNGDGTYTFTMPAEDATVGGLAGGYCGMTDVNSGQNVIWTYDVSTTTLTISPNPVASGETDFSMKNYGASNQPWNSYKDALTTVVIDAGVTSIGTSAFCECRSLESITIPDGVTSIGNYTFLSCNSLKTITLPKGLTNIGAGAFQGCSSLEAITIPASVTSITNNYTFANCNKLATIIVLPITPPTISNNDFLELGSNVSGSKNIYFRNPDYMDNDGWSTIVSEKGYTPGYALVDDGENDIAAIATYLNGTPTNIMLYGRTLYKDGNWNTLCLPFNLDATQVTALLDGNGTLMELATTSNLDENGKLTLDFTTATTIEAGKPYIIKWASGDNLVNPVFTGVTIDATAPTAVTFANNANAYGDCKFVGQYDPFSIVASGASGTNEGNLNEIILLGTGNTLGYSSEPRTLHPFRAHFEVPVGNGGNSVKAYQISFGEGDETGIISIDNGQLTMDNEDGAWYSLDGRKLPGKPAQKGIYIHDGRKVVLP